ncbi:class I adenylate-forming enzyme family protein [Brevibacterium album]|uniref:class I adenylate-forming enzyme family protein n=1 Tax=Brevibacterium album TaxID=417948 RepID=UPI0005584CEC|nr:AMP-binding protein [Brevibacterium album]
MHTADDACPRPPFDTRVTPPQPTMAALWQDRVRAMPEAPFLHCFDKTLTFAEVDARARALASSLASEGLGRGDRIALYTQNDPLFAVGVLAAWKLGCTAVPINPMNTARELSYHLRDSGARALIALPTLWNEVAASTVAESPVEVAILGAFTRWRETDTLVIEEILADLHACAPAPEGLTLLSAEEVYAEHGIAVGAPTASARGTAAASPEAAVPQEPALPSPDDPALLTYTSGTTGQPKGAINTHGGAVFSAEVFAHLLRIAPGAPILAIAPLFHITGSIGHLAFAIRSGSPLVLSHRFHPRAMLETVRRWRPVFTIGAITALMALADQPDLREGDLDSLEVVYSGGSPIAPALAQRLEGVYGTAIHNIFGMSETTSPLIAVPRGERAPVDSHSGSLSIGRPVFETAVRIVDDAGRDVPVGEQGEIWAKGPQITPGYWGREEATREAITDGWLHTGDVGVRDAEGWLYLVDRKKDMINAAGYKVWPREVEGVLYDHPAVSEAAVVGVPDDYRGETVKAYVTLKEGCSAAEAELIAHCRANLSAYKRPRRIEILADMPKTATGKIMRRSLRDEER